MSVVVIATISPQPEHAEEVRQAVLETVPRVHEEPGCERYSLHEGSDGALVLVEKWESPEAQRAHFDSQEMVEMAQACNGLLSKAPDIDLLEGISAHDLN